MTVSHKLAITDSFSHASGVGLDFKRYFTSQDVHPYDEIEWEIRDSRLTDWRTGDVAFEQKDVEFPKSWSVIATNIVSQKYFRGHLGTPERERSVRQLVDRVADNITAWGQQDGYFANDESAQIFNHELKHLLVNQKAAFNSPVWFNVGVEEQPQCSACFILKVEDSMSSILNWYVEEGIIFKGGSGAGVNLSAIRSSYETLKGGGEASGPVSFMRGADASAGTIKSGGKTRRAAKMVILNVDHPDVEEFIWCKQREEEKSRALAAAGFDMSLDGADAASIQYQNANNSVRVTKEFMEAVKQDRDFDLRSVTDGTAVKTMPARDLMSQIAKAAWACADPGIQYDDVINDWHTTPNAGRINGSNPCSEYMHVDNSACNLASINLRKFAEGRNFDVQGFCQAVNLLITAQEIIVSHSSYPTDMIRENTLKFRQLGLGYANLGGLLMSLGLPYDSKEGRAWAGAITALMTGQAYNASTQLARVQGAFEGFAADKDNMLRVLQKHTDAVADIDKHLAPANVLNEAASVWKDTLESAQAYGVRNAQASVLAPTGTIGLMMDCDTTGIEPDLGLVKSKSLVGGGSMRIVNQTVPVALTALGYSAGEREDIIAYIDTNASVVGAPHIKDEHIHVFDCAMGSESITPYGHLRMMAAAQPFLSGAISKTVNLPETATVKDISDIYIEGWELGLKAIAIYRDNCKVAQPMSVSKKSDETKSESETFESVLVRHKLPNKRPSNTISFQVGEAEGYLTAGEYPSGGLGEIFVRLGKQGSTLSGVMDALAISISVGLQHGVPLKQYVQQMVNQRFEPSGFCNDPDFGFSHSLVDYIFRRLAVDYLSFEERQSLNILTNLERMALLADPSAEPSEPEPVVDADGQQRLFVEKASRVDAVFGDAPMCSACGSLMQRAGSCHVCMSCGSTSGCS